MPELQYSICFNRTTCNDDTKTLLNTGRHTCRPFAKNVTP